MYSSGNETYEWLEAYEMRGCMLNKWVLWKENHSSKKSKEFELKIDGTVQEPFGGTEMSNKAGNIIRISLRLVNPRS